jgi:hypothetical protein
MERDSSLNTKEIVGIAAAGAVALGGLVVALTRSHERKAQSEGMGATLVEFGEAAVQRIHRGRRAARQVAERLSSTYPEVRRELAAVAERVGAEAGALRDQLHARPGESLTAGFSEPLAEVIDRVMHFADDRDELSKAPVANMVASVSPSGSSPTSQLRDTLVSIAVISAASALALLFMLSPGRREQLKDALCRLLEYGQVLSDDFRGHDEGF